MFGNCCNCCGRKKTDKIKTIFTKDAETQSDNEVLGVIEPTNDLVIVDTSILQQNDHPVTIQPHTICNHSQSDLSTKRQSVVSDVKIAISDEDNDCNGDDEVFREGVGPPVRLAQNLANSRYKGTAYVQLPQWFSLECDNSEETMTGVQEPPATPVGKDELALRRHRFFSDLFNTAHDADEHKVHFDPMGPVIAGVVSDPNTTQDFETLVSRLEKVTLRLENVCQSSTNKLKSPCIDSGVEYTNGTIDPESPLEEDDFEEVLTMSADAFEDIIRGPLAEFLEAARKIGRDVETQSQMVRQGFHVELDFLRMATESARPSSAELPKVVQPIGDSILKVQHFRETNRTSPFFNHLSAISESIAVLGWLTISPAPAVFVKEMNDAGQYYSNRVLKEFKDRGQEHVDFVKKWCQTLIEMQAYVKQYHTTGLVWGGSGRARPAMGGGGNAPPPPCMPPPPPVPMFNDFPAESNLADDRSALFAEINKGEDITKGLKKVTSEMQTHKNPTLRQGPAPFKASAGGIGQTGAVDKPPVFKRDGKKWLIEYQKGNQNLVVEDAEMNNVVYLFRCTDSTVVVRGKINSITLDSCKKSSVVFDSVVAAVEFINCQSVQMQVLGKVPTISIDKTDGCQMFLNADALDVEIVSSKSSEMNVLLPRGNGDYAEHAIPEQYKTTISPGLKGLNTTIVESKG